MQKSITLFLQLAESVENSDTNSDYKDAILIAREHIEALEAQVSYYQNQAACCSCRRLAEKVAA